MHPILQHGSTIWTSNDDTYQCERIQRKFLRFAGSLYAIILGLKRRLQTISVWQPWLTIRMYTFYFSVNYRPIKSISMPFCLFLYIKLYKGNPIFFNTTLTEHIPLQVFTTQSVGEKR